MSFPHRIRIYWTRGPAEDWKRHFYDTQHPVLVEMHRRIEERAAEVKHDIERMFAPSDGSRHNG